MPRGDRLFSGWGSPMTGRPAGYDMSGYAGIGPRWGHHCGGLRRPIYWFRNTGLHAWLRSRLHPVGDAPLPPEDLGSLKEHEQALRRTLTEIQARIREMEAGNQ